MMDMRLSESFWDYLEKLVDSSQLKIDRPKGTRHPRYPELIYPFDYGFLEGTVAADGGGIDVWLGASGIHELSGVILTVDMHKRDTEIKLLLGCNAEEIQKILDFQNTNSMRAFLVRRTINNNELHAFLRSRRSIRSFKPDRLPHDCIQRILETAIYAPSAHNLQPWRFAVITSAAMKARLAEAITARFRQDMKAEGVPEDDIQARVERSVRRAVQAPVIIVLCRDVTQFKPQPDKLQEQKEALMGTQSVALAGLQLLLAAHAEGLGGTWICWSLFAPEETNRALELPSVWEPQGMLFIGYPFEQPEVPDRMRLEEIALWF